MAMPIPKGFAERLKFIVGESLFDKIVATFSQSVLLNVRVNTLKENFAEIQKKFTDFKIGYGLVPGISNALVLENQTAKQLDSAGFLSDGLIYIQSLSSMLPALILDPRPEERVLDLCAAPGSKASQIAAMMNNRGDLVCVEAIRRRYYKLKSVLSLLGVTNARAVCLDGRRFRDRELYDRILVDAPCSAEGRFRADDKRTQAFWSLRKIREMARKQKGLLLNAARLLKKGGILVYSTCTFAPEENEAVVDWLLRKTEGRVEIQPAHYPDVPTYPALTAWQGRIYDARVSRCMRILPTATMEGFFIAKFTKVA